jgi:hypothetical protein
MPYVCKTSCTAVNPVGEKRGGGSLGSGILIQLQVIGGPGPFTLRDKLQPVEGLGLGSHFEGLGSHFEANKVHFSQKLDAFYAISGRPNAITHACIQGGNLYCWPILGPASRPQASEGRPCGSRSPLLDL